MTALVLAASRPEDPVARARGVTHKALVPVAGRPMILRVAEALQASRSIGSLHVCIEDPQRVATLPAFADGFAAAAGSPSTSVLQAAEKLEFPILVTTADHALLSAEMVDFFCESAGRAKADIAVGLAPASVILRDYPGAVRTFLPFRDDRYSGCNLFALLTPRSLEAVRFWTRAEQYRKQPWKLMRTFGIGSLLLFALRRLTLDAAMERASHVVGAKVAAIKMPFAEAAIDVDKLADLELVETILAQRGEA